MKLKSRAQSTDNPAVGLSLPRALIAACLLALMSAPGALADAKSSSNWAGYAIHHSGVTFTKVTATWTQPTVTCQAPLRSYSAYWVGLGGYGRRSEALEQIGTEADCTASGRTQSSAWYELVPAASRTIRFRVNPGDLVSATVVVIGHRVVVSLHDAMTHRTFRKVLHARQVDVSSAEWIVEAPSDCISELSCQTLPLADFGSASFGLTHARTTTGHVGSISDPDWRSSKISLLPSGRRFVSAGSGGTLGEAIPTVLNPTGSGFGVTFSTVTANNPFITARQASLRAGQLVHPGR